MTTGRVVLLRIVLLIASLLLVLAVGEVYARLFWVGPEHRPPRARHEVEPGMVELDSLFDLAQPNVRGIYKGALHETNDMGIRGPQRTRTPAPGHVRIGVGGDSFTMGWGVDYEDSYVAGLERLLEASTTGPRYEVLNFGLAGLNAPTAVSRLIKKGALYDVDVLVYGFTRNDIEGPHFQDMGGQRSQGDRAERANAWRRSPSALVRMLGPRLQSLVDRLNPATQRRTREFEHNYFGNPAAAGDFALALDALATAVHERRGCGAVLVHTHLGELGWLHPSMRIYEHVEALAIERGLLVIQSYPAFAGMDEPSLWLDVLDPHPNAVGHGILAGALHRGLDRLPPHCLRPRSRTR
jgi:hypothetical protein